MVEHQREPNSMAASPHRSKNDVPLHNFFPSFLKWGARRKMRCSAVGGGDRLSPASNSDDSTATWTKDGIAVVRQKLILDLKTEADRIKDAILRNEEEEGKTARPWNLRKRRAKVEAPVPDGDCRKMAKIDDKKRRPSSPERLPQLRSATEKTERVKFSSQLSKKEIEEDFIAMLGYRPPRRPNKRPKHVQNQLDTLWPGLWLTEVTADTYKVTGKRKDDGGF